LSAVSGRVNPNGLIRDARAEAARRGLVWREMWVRRAETGCKYKMHHLLAERTAGMRRSHERVSVGTPSESPDTLAGDPQGGSASSQYAGVRAPAERRPSPSRWQDEVGVSGAARATSGEQGRLL